MAGRRLRLVRVNATELVGLEQTGRQFRACGSRAFLLCGVCTSRHPVSRFFSRWMSEFVKVCGCRPHDGGAAHTGAGVRKPPKEETAGGVERLCVRRYGDLTAVVPECEHNFCDMARTLRKGGNTFRRPCNFKKLRVVKRAHITTCALCT
jgi:hypothetical protein